MLKESETKVERKDTGARVLLVANDNGSYISWFPQGLAYIASALRNHGHEVSIYNQDVYHYPRQHLTDLLDREPFDVVGVSVIAGYYQYRKLLEISEAINTSRNRPFYVIGGHGPAPEPEYFMKKTKADAIVIGEGEKTVVELMEAVGDKKRLSCVQGIAYNENGKCKINSRRSLITNIDTIDHPAWDLFPMDHYSLIRSYPHLESTDRNLPVLSGRGCLFECNFCFRLDKGFRPRTAGNILEEIKKLQRDYSLTAVDFSDELLMSSEKRTIELCETILDSGMKFKWGCNGRLNFVTEKNLALMKKAGCVFINYGIESLDQTALNKMKKGLSIKMIHEGVRKTIEAGISPGLNIIWGNIGETKESLRLGVEFLLQNSDFAQMRTIRPVTPYPGSPLYYYAIKQGLLEGPEDFYEHKHVNSDLLAVNFTNLSNEQFHQALFVANERLIRAYYQRQLENTIDQARKLYQEKDVAFRGFR